MVRDSLKRLVPVKLRRWRGELLHALRRDEAHFERVERRAFFRRAFRAVAFNGMPGDYAEFGCCGGQTFGLAFRESRRAGLNVALWAFDSFSGLPPQAGLEDAHPVWVEGDMHISLDDFRKVCRSYGMTDGSCYGAQAGAGRDRRLRSGLLLAGCARTGYAAPVPDAEIEADVES